MLPSLVASVRLLRLTPRLPAASQTRQLTTSQTRHVDRDVRVPAPGVGIQYRYRVQLPEQYTIKRLPIQKLAGRDPVTGRVVVGTLGGGSKQKYRWVDPRRAPLEDGSPRQERVLQLLYDPLRSCTIALVAHAEHIRYVVAHQGMQEGDIITCHGEIPRIPVRPRVGDAHPLGALPAGTEIFNVEKYLGEETRMCVHGGTHAVVLRRVGDRVIVQTPTNKRQYSLKHECTCVVGRVMEKTPAKYPIGSAQRLRWLGHRPRSGLWQRKTGRFGRKVRRPPPLSLVNAPPQPTEPKLVLTLRDFHIHDANSTDKLYRTWRTGVTN